MTLLEKAKAIGAEITRVKVSGYPVYRVKCSVCYRPGEDGRLPSGSNYSAAEVRTAMNDHARWHLANPLNLPMESFGAEGRSD